MDRTTSITRIITAGFPRSGNSFLGQLLQQSFPIVDAPVFSHNVNTLNTAGCIVPIRNPYQSVPSWSAFSREQDLEATARWYMRFNSKVLDNINNLITIDFVKLSTTPLLIVDKVSKHLGLIPKEIDTSVLNKNSKFREYKEYNSPLMKDCFNLYTKIVGQL